MTVALAWTRKLTEWTEELVFVTDSRYRGGDQNFDVCPKVITLPRSDCALCFAGYTGHALPMMLQVSEAIGSFDRATRRSQDLAPLKTHIIKIFNKMSEDIVKSLMSPHAQDPLPEASFLIGGYSWINKAFDLWEIFFQKGQGCFEERPARWLTYLPNHKKYGLWNAKTPEALGRLAFIGDQGSAAYAALTERLLSKGTPDRLDWEPFEVVRDMLRADSHCETIGGAPQVVKVYQYMQADPLAVFWPDKKSGCVTLKGRKCLGYERLGRRILDPDTLKSEPWTIPDELKEGDPLSDS